MSDAATTTRRSHRAHVTREPGEEGSLVTEYGLVAVLGATIAGIAIKWAAGGAVFELLGALMRKVRLLVGA